MNECPKCGENDAIEIERWRKTIAPDKLQDRETGHLICTRCKRRFQPRHTEAMSVDITERLEVLEAVARGIQSRLVAIRSPQAMLDHAASLEHEAERIFDMAQRIRNDLANDLASVDELEREAERIALEIAACVVARTTKTPVTRKSLAWIVELLMSKGN